MSLTFSFIAPLAMMLPASGPQPHWVEQQWSGPMYYTESLDPTIQVPEVDAPQQFIMMLPFAEPGPFSALQMISDSFRMPVQNQVRIEEHITIRITPRSNSIQPTMLMDTPIPAQPRPRKLEERSFGKCISVSGIAAVQADDKNRLRLYLRDQRMISAALDRTCSANDFYSGFYVAKNADGQLCVNRDTLRARNGANCKVTKLRQLVPAGG